MANKKPRIPMKPTTKQTSVVGCLKKTGFGEQMSIVRERIFDYAFGEALGYATSQKAFNPNHGKAEKAEEAKRKAMRIIAQKAKSPVKDFIQGLLDRKGEGCDDAFMACAKAVAKRLQGESFGVNLNATTGKVSEFTFGNIQKLINMTVKNMYGRYFDDEEKRACFKNCHCPMDDIMMKTVVKEYTLKGKDEQLKKKAKWSAVRWSKLVFKNTNDEFSKSHYDDFQKMVRELAAMEGLTPIEYDFVHWNFRYTVR